MEKDTSLTEERIQACFGHKGIEIYEEGKTLAFEFERRVFADSVHIKDFEKAANVQFSGVVRSHGYDNGFRLLFYKL